MEVPLRSADLPEVDEDAWYGLAGDYAREVARDTEADPLAVLVLALAWVGARIGYETFAAIPPDVHPPRIWPMLIGNTATGRKGTAEGHSLSALSALSTYPRRATGLSSGEGLINAFMPGEDDSVPDPRLLVTESEWEAVQAQLRRDRNTLSAVMRDAWDGKPLGTMTIKARRVEHHHLVVVGQITPPAFLSVIDHLSLANGFLNRFLPLLVARPHLVPLPPDRSPRAESLLRAIIRDSERPPAGRLELSTKAKKAFSEWYVGREEARLSANERVAQATARGTANLLRTAVILAALDGRSTIQLQHIRAAAAVVDYSDKSVETLLGSGALGLDQKILDILTSSGGSMSRDNLRTQLSKNLPAAKFEAALTELVRAGQVFISTEATLGRPRQVISTSSRSEGSQTKRREGEKGLRIARVAAKCSAGEAAS